MRRSSIPCGFWGKLNTETECVAELMKMYQEMTK